jgi:OOP family OmpA-OmpF porin
MFRVAICAMVSLSVLWIRPASADACGVKMSVRAPRIKRTLVARRSSPILRRALVARKPIRVGPSTRAVRPPLASGGHEAGAGASSVAASAAPDTRSDGGTVGAAAGGTAAIDPGANDAADTRAGDTKVAMATTTKPVTTTEVPREERAPRRFRGRFTSRIFFANASVGLMPYYRARLDRNARWLSKHVNKDVTIEGHTNTVGSAPLNKALSEKRAEVVKHYLVEKGVDESRISVKAFGLEKPEFSPGQNPKNRRVVIVVK